MVAQGGVAVDQEVKAVQHRDGGIIRSIAVREGDTVTEGRVLISLDDAAKRAELSIIVRRVGAATTRDPATGHPFYLAEIALEPEELAKLPDERLLPGMPVEVHIQTETRTALSDFARPITDQFSRAFRER